MTYAEEEIIKMHRYLYPEQYADTDNPVTDHPHYEPGDECFEWRGADTMEAIAEWITNVALYVERHPTGA